MAMLLSFRQDPLLPPVSAGCTTATNMKTIIIMRVLLMALIYLLMAFTVLI